MQKVLSAFWKISKTTCQCFSVLWLNSRRGAGKFSSVFLKTRGNFCLAWPTCWAIGKKGEREEKERGNVQKLGFSSSFCNGEIARRGEGDFRILSWQLKGNVKVFPAPLNPFFGGDCAGDDPTLGIHSLLSPFLPLGRGKSSSRWFPKKPLFPTKIPPKPTNPQFLGEKWNHSLSETTEGPINPFNTQIPAPTRTQSWIVPGKCRFGASIWDFFPPPTGPAGGICSFLAVRALNYSSRCCFGPGLAIPGYKSLFIFMVKVIFPLFWGGVDGCGKHLLTAI